MNEIISHTDPVATRLNWSREWLWVLPVVALALFVRLSGLDKVSLWCDEIRQVTYYYDDNYKQVMYSAATQSQPPLDYWIGFAVFKFWHSDWAARFPAAVFGTLLVLCTFFLARKMVSRPVAFLVALGVACSPYAIHYSQEARPYVIFWFFLVLTMLTLVNAWERNRWRDWAIFLPVLVLCLLTRVVAPVLMTVGMGLWALSHLYSEYHHRRATFLTGFLRHRPTRLSLCLVAAWVPHASLLHFIFVRGHTTDFLAEELAPVAGLPTTFAALARVCESLVHSTAPLSWLLLPIGVLGIALYLCPKAGLVPSDEVADKSNLSASRRIIFVPLVAGFVIHLFVHVLVFIRLTHWVPRYAYWAYALPFLYLGVGCVLEFARERWRKSLRSAAPLRVAWGLAATLMVFQLGIDHNTLIATKADWRGALATIERELDSDRDVVFCSEAIEFGQAGMRFRISPHYLPSDDHFVNVVRDPQMIANEGRPVLGRRDCRVALLVRCDPDFDGEILRARLSPSSSTAFDYYDFERFLLLMTREKANTPEEGLALLAGGALEMIGRDHPHGSYLASAQSWALAKLGSMEEARQAYQDARRMVGASGRAEFEEWYHSKTIAMDGDQTGARLISAPQSSAEDDF